MFYLLWYKAPTLSSWNDTRDCRQTDKSNQITAAGCGEANTVGPLSTALTVTFSSPVGPAEPIRSSGSTQDGRVTNGDGLGPQAGQLPWRQRKELCRETNK